MNKTPSITNADDAKLCELISGARERVLLVSPGVSEEVARVREEAWPRLGPEAVDVILDVDPEVCRLGYGTLEGLKIVRAAATRAGSCVSHQPGIRIGVLICDHTTLIFSPTPLLIGLGGNYLSLQPGGEDELLEDGGEIEFTQGSIDVIDLLGQEIFRAGDDGEEE